MHRTVGAVFAALLLTACADRAPDDKDDTIDTAAKESAQMSARLDYVEIGATNIERTREFYAEAFGWTFTDFAPTYTATTTGDTDIGIDSGPDREQLAPLPVVRVSDLSDALESVEQAGGRITKPIFAFPGGRRFEAVDPSGNAFAVYIANESKTDR